MIEKIFRIFLFLVVIFLFLSLVRSLLKVRQVNIRISEKKAQIAKIQSQNEELKRRVEETRSQYNIEKQLRDNLGLAKAGETIVVLPPDEVLKTLVPKIENEEEDALPDPNWKQWLRLFI